MVNNTGEETVVVHSILGKLLVGEVSRGETLNWGLLLVGKDSCRETLLTGECTAAEISVAQILQEDQLGGELANCWLLAGGEIQLSGSSPDWGVYCSRVYRSRTSAVGKSLLGKALLEEASCRRTSYYYFAIPHHLNSAAGCHVSLLLFLSDKCYHM